MPNANVFALQWNIGYKYSYYSLISKLSVQKLDLRHRSDTELQFENKNGQGLGIENEWNLI